MASSPQRSGVVLGWLHRDPAESSDDIEAYGMMGTLDHFPASSWQWQMGSEAFPGGYMVAENPV